MPDPWTVAIDATVRGSGLNALHTGRRSHTAVVAYGWAGSDAMSMTKR